MLSRLPDTVISDGGPQYTSDKFKMFSEKWGFRPDMSSPGNGKANGAAEAADREATVKKMQNCI